MSGADARRLSRQQKAAVIIGVLGAEAAGTVLEQLDETSLRHFTHAMSGLKRIDATQVRATIAEFLTELAHDEEVVRGGLAQARGLLEQHVGEGLLLRILDDVESPSAHNVWQKLAKVSDEALADFLAREHPQTTAVVVSKFSPEHAARILNRLDPEMARDVVIGLARVASLDPHVIEAIGDTMSRDFLATHSDADHKRNPADRVGFAARCSPSKTSRPVCRGAPSPPWFVRSIRKSCLKCSSPQKKAHPKPANSSSATFRRGWPSSFARSSAKSPRYGARKARAPRRRSSASSATWSRAAKSSWSRRTKSRSVIGKP